MFCTYLAHHELESKIAIIVITIIITVIIIIIIIVITGMLLVGEATLLPEREARSPLPKSEP